MVSLGTGLIISSILIIFGLYASSSQNIPSQLSQIAGLLVLMGGVGIGLSVFLKMKILSR